MRRRSYGESTKCWVQFHPAMHKWQGRIRKIFRQFLVFDTTCILRWVCGLLIVLLSNHRYIDSCWIVPIGALLPGTDRCVFSIGWVWPTQNGWCLSSGTGLWVLGGQGDDFWSSIVLYIFHGSRNGYCRPVLNWKWEMQLVLRKVCAISVFVCLNDGSGQHIFGLG